jgi:hypothetical protein
MLKAGSYTVIVRDATGGQTSASVTITQPQPLVLNVTAGTIQSYGGTTTVTLSASGGTSPYTYAGPTSNVKAGTYTYTVEDANGCRDAETITITQPELLKGRYKRLGSAGIGRKTVSSATSLPSTDPKAGPAGDYFNLYPNPVVSSTTLTITSAQMGTGTISIIDLKGVVRRQYQVQKSTATFTHNLDLSGLSKGYYVLRLQIGAEYVLTKKFLKM